MIHSNNVIEYSIGDTINTPIHFYSEQDAGTTMRFVIAVDDSNLPIIDKIFNMKPDGTFIISLSSAERNLLKIGKYIYKVILNGIDGSIRTCQSGYFIVTWFAARDNVINLSTGYKPLIFDSTPMQGSSNPVTSDGIYNFVKENASGGSASVVVDSKLSSTSENPVQNKVITQALDNKQDKLTFDYVPTLGSKNPVTSEGIKLYVDEQNLLYDGVMDKKKVDKHDNFGTAVIEYDMGSIEDGNISYVIGTYQQGDEYGKGDDWQEVAVGVYPTGMLYTKKEVNTAISNAIGDVNTALENIIEKYGLGGDEA